MCEQKSWCRVVSGAIAPPWYQRDSTSRCSCQQQTDTDRYQISPCRLPVLRHHNVALECQTLQRRVASVAKHRKVATIFGLSARPETWPTLISQKAKITVLYHHFRTFSQPVHGAKSVVVHTHTRVTSGVFSVVGQCKSENRAWRGKRLCWTALRAIHAGRALRVWRTGQLRDNCC